MTSLLQAEVGRPFITSELSPENWELNFGFWNDEFLEQRASIEVKFLAR